MVKVSLRQQRGQASEIFLLVTVLIAFCAAGLAIDAGRLCMVRSQLQQAADAAALAGACEALKDESAARDCALAVANSWTVNGTPLARSPLEFNFAIVREPDGTNISRVELSYSVQHYVMWMVGRVNDSVTAVARAGSTSRLGMIASGKCFPLAVCLDAPDVRNGVILRDRKIGDRLTLAINSTGVKNASFTSYSRETTDAHYIKSAVAEVLQATTGTVVPSVATTETIHLINGIAGQKELAQDTLLTQLKAQTQIILPVIDCAEPSNSGCVVGFMGLKVEDVSTKGQSEVLSITGTIVPSVSIGTADFDEGNDGAFEQFATRAVVLIE